MMRRIFVCLALFVVLLSGCAKDAAPPAGTEALTLSFDAGGSYTGFDTLPQDYTVQQAIEDGCYVREGAAEAGGNGAWRNFVEDAAGGEDASIRTMLVFDEDTYYLDLFYSEGSYLLFDSSSEDLSRHPYQYLLELNGRLPNAERDSYFAVLTDDESLTFSAISSSLFSSDSTVTQSVSPYEFVIMGVV